MFISIILYYTNNCVFGKVVSIVVTYLLNEYRCML